MQFAMKKILLLFLTSASLFVACKSDPSTHSGQNPEGAVPGATTEIAPASIKFICQAVEIPNTDSDAPHNEVYLQMGNSRVKVGDILSCETIAKEQYEQYQIPASAIDAAGGWWAGAGDYFYVAEEGGNYVVRQGAMFEEQEDNSYNYKTVMTFSKDGKEVF
jgi:uncharacterized Zn-finger protein